MTRFVIITAPRTGSNYLCSLLNSHPLILCHHEIFNPKGIHYAIDHREGQIDLGTLQERAMNPAEFVQRIWDTSLHYRYVGFKLGWRQPEAVFEAIYADPQVKVILLSRRNRLKMYVSEQVALTEGRWTHYHVPTAQLPPIKVEVNVEHLLEYTKTIDEFFRGVMQRLQDRGHGYKALFYEDLFSAETEAEILDFLGLQQMSQPLQAASVKRNPNDLRQFVTNFEQLERELACSRFANELTDRGL